MAAPPLRGGARLALLLRRVAAAGAAQEPARASSAALAGCRGGRADDGVVTNQKPSSEALERGGPLGDDGGARARSAQQHAGDARGWPAAWAERQAHRPHGAAAAGAATEPDAADAQRRRNGRRRRQQQQQHAWSPAAASPSLLFGPPLRRHPDHHQTRHYSAAVVNESPDQASPVHDHDAPRPPPPSSPSPSADRPSRGRRGPDFGDARARHAAAAAAAAAPPAPRELLEVPEGPPYRWRLSVITGNVRGAGTHAPVTLQLVGSKGASPTVPVGESDEGDSGLARATAVALELALDRDIGQLRRVRVQRAPGSTSGTGEGWFLDRVEVSGPHREALVLPCRAWFGSSDCGDFVGALERNLIPVEDGGEYGAAGARGERWAEVVGQAPVEVRAAGVAFPHPEKVIKGGVRGVVARGFGYGGEDAFFFATGGATRASAAWHPVQRRSAAAPPDARCTNSAAITGCGGGGGGGGGAAEDEAGAAAALALPFLPPRPRPPPPPSPDGADASAYGRTRPGDDDDEPQFEIPQLSAGAGPAAATSPSAGAGAGPAAGAAGAPGGAANSPAAPAAGAGPAAVFGMGVSDGVYMWKEVGIDSGAMSRTLMETASHSIVAGCEDALRVLQVAARHVESEGVAGSATACVLTVNKAAARLQAATLGDSGFFVLSPILAAAAEAPGGALPSSRGGGAAATEAGATSASGRPSLGPATRPPSSAPAQPTRPSSSADLFSAAALTPIPPSARMAVRYRSPQLEREFGCPYQLGHHAGAQAAEDADLVALPVGPGDVIVMGTDGLLDNLSEAEILREVQLEAAAAADGARARGEARRLAHALALSAAKPSSSSSPTPLAAGLLSSSSGRGGVHFPSLLGHAAGGGQGVVHARGAAAAAGGGGGAGQGDDDRRPRAAAPPPPSALIAPASLAHRLARLAFEASVDRSRSTPYSRAATEAFDMVYSGGKPDDITVVVAVIT